MRILNEHGSKTRYVARYFWDTIIEMDIDQLTVNKCYKLNADHTYLGKLTAEPMIEGSGDGREKVAHFIHKGKTTSKPRWADFEADKKNLFIEVECEQEGGRRKSRRKSLKRRRTRHRR